MDQIEQFEPVHGEWLPLDAFLTELFEGEVGPTEQAVLLRLLERYPEEDGAGVLWGVVHGLESTAHYEPSLLASVKRMPSDLGLVMLNRLHNSGVEIVDGERIEDVFRAVADSETASESVRATALDLLGAME
ncbi:MAG: hypothetical protein AAFX41_04645 [Bacteroidota bacterium]